MPMLHNFNAPKLNIMSSPRPLYSDTMKETLTDFQEGMSERAPFAISIHIHQEIPSLQILHCTTAR